MTPLSLSILIGKMAIIQFAVMTPSIKVKVLCHLLEALVNKLLALLLF